MKKQQGSNTPKGIVYLIFMILFLWGNSTFFFGEREGFIKIDDCRQKIILNNDSWQRFYHEFTCNYNKDSNGKLIEGTCARINNSIFSNSHSCDEAYVYEKKPEIGASRYWYGKTLFFNGKIWEEEREIKQYGNPIVDIPLK